MKISRLFPAVWRRAVLPAVLVAVLAGGSGCSDDVSSDYSSHRAFFRYTMVNTTPELLSALTTAGRFCAVDFPPNYYRFSDAEGHATQVPRTALDQYGQPVFICGFLVGTPALLDFSGNFVPVAYDLACPGCYESAYLNISLDFDTPTQVSCRRCGREYDLNNQGISTGEGKRYRLYRYRLSYAQAQGMLVIQN